jgi:hypothetical protein
MGNGLDLGLWSLSNCEEYISVVEKPHDLWYFVRAAQKDYDKHCASTAQEGAETSKWATTLIRGLMLPTALPWSLLLTFGPSYLLLCYWGPHPSWAHLQLQWEKQVTSYPGCNTLLGPPPFPGQGRAGLRALSFCFLSDISLPDLHLSSSNGSLPSSF